MIKFKKIISSILAIGMISSCLQSMAFANTTVTWKETFSTINLTIPETETYDAETGTFAAGRAIDYTNTTGSSSNYMYGVELTEALKSGKVTVELELSNIPNIAAAQQMYLFAVSSESKGWTVQSDSTTSELRSELVIRDSKGQVQSSSKTALDDTYRARWNTELVTLVSGSGVKLDRDSNGVHKLRFVAEAADENSAWNISIYHYGKSTSKPVYTYTISRTALPDLKYIFNQARINNNATLSFTVDKFKVKAVDANYSIKVLESSLADASIDVPVTPEVDFKFNGTVVPTQDDSTPDDFSDNVKIYEYNNETLGEAVSSDNYTVVKSQDETNPAYDHLKITVTQPLEAGVTYAIVMDKIKKAGSEDIDGYNQEVIRTFTTLKEFKITANVNMTDDTAALDVTVKNVGLQEETKPYLIIMALMSDTNGVRKVHKTYYAEYPSETLELQPSGAYAKELVVPTKTFTSVPANGYLKIMLWSKVNSPVEYTDEVIIPLNN